MAPLDGALALSERDDSPVLVAQDLELDVPGPVDELLQVDVGALEAHRRLVLRLMEGALEFGRRSDDAHAASAAARGGLDDDRIADLRRFAPRRLDGLERLLDALQDGHARLAHGLACLRLVSHQANRFRGRADEGQPGDLADLGERGVLGQKAVSRMNRVDPGDLGGADHRRHVQIALRRPGRSDAHGLVGVAHVQRAAIRVGIDGDGADP